MARVERRVGFLFAVFCFLISVSVARAAWIQGVQGSDLRADARHQQTEVLPVPAARGTIEDRNGRPLAVSEDAFSVVATPYLVEDPPAAAREIAPLVGVDEETVLRKLSDRKSGFAYLRRKLEPSQARKVEKLEIVGVDLVPDTRRVYPQGELASQLLGTVGLDDEGLAGVELAHERTLRGTPGERRIVKDALGEPIDSEPVSEAVPGRPMRLTVDSTIQAHSERVLDDVGERFKPRGASVIVMDPSTSELLAVANWPSADANALGDAPDEARLNRAGGFVYEPGSTFKAFTVAAALEDGTVSSDTSFDLPPTIQVADRTIREAHERGHVSLTVADILAQSSNVGSVRIGMALGAESFDGWIRTFGFGETTGSGIPGEERGIVPALRDYSGSTMGNLPIGQGLSVTPLQMAAGYAAIADDGILRPPRLVASVAGREPDAARGTRVVSAETAREVREMLEGVLAAGGTASEVQVPGYELAGKTGTAEKVVDGVYSKTRFVASFVGFAPADRPELLVAVVVDEPQGSIYGGDVAAPAFGEIASLALPHLGIPPG